jgi:type I restriction-modification system DNA methylase subunit
MSGAEREKLRVKATGEVFTPTPLVQEILDQLPQELFKDPAKTFIDPSCGDGQFLGEVVIRKMENGSTLEQALSTTYGVDLMPDNVRLCQDRLLCGQEQYRHIVEKNIVCHDALTYDYSFNGTNKTNKELHMSSLFDFS